MTEQYCHGNAALGRRSRGRLEAVRMCLCVSKLLPPSAVEMFPSRGSVSRRLLLLLLFLLAAAATAACSSGGNVKSRLTSFAVSDSLQCHGHNVFIHEAPKQQNVQIESVNVFDCDDETIKHPINLLIISDEQKHVKRFESLLPE